MIRLPQISLLALIGLLGCSQPTAPEATTRTESAAVRMAPPAMEASADLSAAPEAEEAPPTAGETALPIGPRKVIFHANIRLRVAELSQADHRIDSLVRRYRGFRSAVTEERAAGEWRQTATLRVPPPEFDPLVDALGQLGTVEQKTVGTDDVTEAHADLSARLGAKRALEQEYLRLLKQARKVSEMLEVEEKLGEVREEIESMESRLRTLNDRVDLATITLTCYQPVPLPTPDTPVVSVASRLATALYTGWEISVGLVIGVVTLWPIWLLLGLGTWVGRRWWRRRPLAGQ